MKKIIFCLLLSLPCWLFAQIGIKGGLNFSGITNTSSIKSSNQTGYNVGILFGAFNKSIIGFRTEMTYSKQGYNYQNETNTGKIDLQYFMSTNLATINISKYFQLQVGFQSALLLNAKADSSKVDTSILPFAKLLDSYNRFDYGLAGGFEVHPVGGLLIGARLNVSLGKLYKKALSGESPGLSDITARNNVLQLYAGWRFSQSSAASKKKEPHNSKE